MIILEKVVGWVQRMWPRKSASNPQPDDVGVLLPPAAAVAIYAAYSLLVLLLSSVMAFGVLRVLVASPRHSAVVEACEIVTEQNFVSYRVRTRGRAELLPINTCDYSLAGERVTTLEDAGTMSGTIAVRGDVTVLKILEATMQSSAGIFIFFALGSLLSLTARGVNICLFLFEAARSQFAQVRPGQGRLMPRVARMTEALTDVLFLGLLITLASVLAIAALKGILFMDRSSEEWFVAATMGIALVVWSPGPKLVIAAIWNAYTTNGVTILRNLIASALMLQATRNLVRFVDTADFSSYESLLGILQAVLKAALGL